MEIKEKKRQLHKILENMYKAIDNENFTDFDKLSDVYNRALSEIFEHVKKPGSEGFDWDVARNPLITLITAKTVFKGEKWEKYKKEQLVEALKRIEKLKKYL